MKFKPMSEAGLKEREKEKIATRPSEFKGVTPLALANLTAALVSAGIIEPGEKAIGGAMETLIKCEKEIRERISEEENDKESKAISKQIWDDEMEGKVVLVRKLRGPSWRSKTSDALPWEPGQTSQTPDADLVRRANLGNTTPATDELRSIGEKRTWEEITDKDSRMELIFAVLLKYGVCLPRPHTQSVIFEIGVTQDQLREAGESMDMNIDMARRVLIETSYFERAYWADIPKQEELIVTLLKRGAEKRKSLIGKKAGAVSAAKRSKSKSKPPNKTTKEKREDAKERGLINVVDRATKRKSGQVRKRSKKSI